MSTRETIDLLAETNVSSAEYRLLELPPEIAALLERADESSQAAKTSKKRKLDTSHGIDDEGDQNGEEWEWNNRRKVLTINGRFLDDAVVSTNDKTYSLRTVSQSNSLLICKLDPARLHPLANGGSRSASPCSSDSGLQMPTTGSGALSQDSSIGASVTGKPKTTQHVLALACTCKETLELQWIPPRLERIETLLRASAFQGLDEEQRTLNKMWEKDPDAKLYSIKEVRSVVQASEVELRRGLKEYRVAQIDGFARMMDPAYVARTLLPILLNHLDLHAHSADAVPERATIEALVEENGLSKMVVKKMLTSWFGRRADSANPDAVGANADDDEEAEAEAEGGKGKGKAVEHVVRLDLPTISRALGVQVLKEVAQPNPAKLADVMHHWTTLLGETYREHADLSLLRGEHLAHPAPPQRATASIPVRLQYFPSASLSLDAAARFQELFLTRGQWLLDDLLPFIANLAVDKNKQDALLLRFCRTSKVKLPPLKTESVGSRRSKTPGSTQKAEEVVVYSSRLRY